MVNPETWKTIAHYTDKAWSAVGPLFGVLVGAWLATNNQRRLWVLDNKRAEYRKLMSTLSESATAFVFVYGRDPSPAEGPARRAVDKAAQKSGSVIFNRLFIAKKIEELRLIDRWTDMTAAYRKDHDTAKFGKELKMLMHDIRTAAVEDLS